MEATVVDRLVERGATHHHAFLEATLAGSQTIVGAITPCVQRFDARGVGHCRFECARIDDRRKAGHVAETERRGQALPRMSRPSAGRQQQTMWSSRMSFGSTQLGGGIGRNHADSSIGRGDR